MTRRTLSISLSACRSSGRNGTNDPDVPDRLSSLRAERAAVESADTPGLPTSIERSWTSSSHPHDVPQRDLSPRPFTRSRT